MPNASDQYLLFLSNKLYIFLNFYMILSVLERKKMGNGPSKATDRKAGDKENNNGAVGILDF